MFCRLVGEISDSRSCHSYTAIFTCKKKTIVTDTERKRNGVIFVNLDENIGIGCLKEKYEQRQKNQKGKIFVIPVKYCAKKPWVDAPYGKSTFRLCNQDQNHALA